MEDQTLINIKLFCYSINESKKMENNNFSDNWDFITEVV